MTGRPESDPRADLGGRLDAAIDALLDGRAALVSADTPSDVELLATARLLHEALPRFHPRFGFEERLARRLRSAAPVDDALPDAAADAAEPRLLVPPSPRTGTRRRGLVAGGAIASGLSLAIPLAGAALVAWRRSRPTGGVS